MKTRNLVKTATCPHCWHKFIPEDVLWISKHDGLYGDEIAGEQENQRFLPSRFTVRGEALDARGLPCDELACPQCHLRLVHGCLEAEPLFLSVIGAPASGKSVFLSSLIWELKRLLGTQFNLAFREPDTAMNAILTSNIDAMFKNVNKDNDQGIDQLVLKTQLGGEIYSQVSISGQKTTLPKPHLYSIYPADDHLNAKKVDKLSRILCLYDNAGEHFRANVERDAVPISVTRHMAHAEGIIFLFDPLQDERFREACGRDELQDLSDRDAMIFRQDEILHEMANRIQTALRLRQGQKHDKPLFVVLTKYDLWNDFLPIPEWKHRDEPFKVLRKRREDGSVFQQTALDMTVIKERSNEIRSRLVQLIPEVVTAAEGFSNDVYYIPSSALGQGAEVATDGRMTVKPGAIEPFWVTVPVLCALRNAVSGLIPAK